MRKVLTFIAAAALLSGCYYDNEEELYPAPSGPGGGCDTATVTFQSDILPVMQQSCALSGCHATGSALGGYILDNYAGVKAAVNANRLLGAVNHESGFSPMPKNGTKLDACTLAKIGKWVSEGAQQN